MKKRILFVDDEPLVLEGIQRSLRTMRQEWDMDFAEGGEKAKERVDDSAYDVVITDMMMPGVDGADLLLHVRECSPRTIRLVLSGHAEQHLAMKCVGIAHQYLSKPCDADSLKTTVARVTDLGFAVRNEQVMALVAKLDRLPSIPTVYSKIVRMLNNPDTSMDEVGAVIASDMAMTAKILKIVNSSFFGLAQRVSNPADAASYLGMKTLKALVLATGVFGQFESNIAKNFSAAGAAEHGQLVGAAARAIAQSEQAPRSLVDDSLVAGLLHDVGKLILASNLPEEFQRTGAGNDAKALENEREVFGATHAEVGGYLLGLWGLQPQVVEAINLHHTPGESQTQSFCPLTAVHAADALIAERSANGSPAAGVDMEYLARLGLSDRLPQWRTAMAQL